MSTLGGPLVTSSRYVSSTAEGVAVMRFTRIALSLSIPLIYSYDWLKKHMMASITTSSVSLSF